jgi:CheY-like chemotaxis protein
VYPRVLVVDWDEGEARALAAALAAAGWAVSVRLNSLDGLVAVEDERPALVVLRWDMPHIDGDVFVRAVAAGLPAPPPILALAAAAVVEAPPPLPLPVRWLPLPAEPAAVRRRVREVLGSPSWSAGA